MLLAFADDELHVTVTQNIKLDLNTVENIVGKELTLDHTNPTFNSPNREGLLITFLIFAKFSLSSASILNFDFSNILYV